MRVMPLVLVAMVMTGVRGVGAQVPAVGAEPGATEPAAPTCESDVLDARLLAPPPCSVVRAPVHPLRGDVAPGVAARPSTRDVVTLPALPRSGEGSRARLGAVVGAVAGGVATYVLLHSGGSTSLCDRSANQDAMGKRECVGLTVAGAAAGAGLGAWLGSRFH